MSYLSFDASWKIFAAGFVSYPVAKYIACRYGSVLIEDIKKIAYKVWDKIKFWK